MNLSCAQMWLFVVHLYEKTNCVEGVLGIIQWPAARWVPVNWGSDRKELCIFFFSSFSLLAAAAKDLSLCGPQITMSVSTVVWKIIYGRLGEGFHICLAWGNQFLCIPQEAVTRLKKIKKRLSYAFRVYLKCHITVSPSVWLSSYTQWFIDQQDNKVFQKGGVEKNTKRASSWRIVMATASDSSSG